MYHHRQDNQWVRAHPHLSTIAAKLRSTALGELPEELESLLMKLAERERRRSGNEGSSGKPGAGM